MSVRMIGLGSKRGFSAATVCVVFTALGCGGGGQSSTTNATNNPGGGTSAAGGSAGSPGGVAGSSSGGSGGNGGTPQATMGGSSGVSAGGGAANTGGGGTGGSSGGTGGANSGGAAGSAGGSGGSGGAAGGTGGTMGDCPAGALICDDFESYTTPADLMAAWTVNASMATVVVDATKPHAGQGALHITSTGQTPQGAIVRQDAPLFPIAGDVYYGRLMMWLTQAPTGGVHWNNVQSAGFMPNSTQWSKYGWGGMYGTILAGYTIRNNPMDMQAVIDCSKPSAMALPEKKWTCFEWEFDGASNQMHLWLDGTLVSDADIITTGTQCVTPMPPNNVWQAPVFANIMIGWLQYQPSDVPIDFWVDDLVVNTQRVGCPMP